jgi:peptidyl-prolyl cis-trans isomerase C
MAFVLLLCLTLPQDYVNLLMEGRYEDASAYCTMMIDKNKNIMEWTLEKGDVCLDKTGEYEKAAEIYSRMRDIYKKKDGWLHYRLALALERAEDFLDAAKSYEIVATQYRKSPLDSFALSGVERCFKKNYQEFVAMIDGYPITRLELDEKISSSPALGKKDEKNILDQMILERLIYTGALKHNIQNTDDYMEQIKEQRRSLLVKEVQAIDVINKAQPSERDMKKYYKKNKENYVIRESIRGKEIVVDSDSLAQMLLDSLTKDIASFDTLAKQYSTAATARSGGYTGLVHKNIKPEPVEKALFKAKPNEIIGVVEFDNQFGIYLVIEHTPKKYREFDEVKAQVEASLRSEKMKEIEEKLLKDLRKKSDIVIYDDIIRGPVADTIDEVVAEVNGRAIHRSDVQRRNAMQPRFAQTQLLKPDEYLNVINTMIDEDVKVEYAERNKYFLNEGYVVNYAMIAKKLLETGLYKKIVVDAAHVDSQEVLDYYEENKEEFKIPESVRCDEIGTSDKELAKKLRAELMKNPEMFDSLAQEHSILMSRHRSGDTGLVRKGMRGQQWEKIAFGLKVGEFSSVFMQDDTTYVFLKCVENNPTQYRSFEEVQRSIETNLLRQEQREIADAFLKKIREEAEIEIMLDQEETEEMPEPQGDFEEQKE